VSTAHRYILASEDRTQPYSQAAQKPSLGILTLAKNGGGSGTEVIMPVLDVDEEEEQYATAPSTHDITTTPLPIINITKPPVPIPITVPTAHDIIALPSPPDSTHSSLDLDAGDLESGRGISMRQLPNSHVAPSRKPTKQQPGTKVEITDSASTAAALIPLPVSPTTSSSPQSLLHDPISDITDLLDDSAPPMESIPIERASSSPSKASFNLEPVRKAQDDLVDSSLSTSEDPDPDPDTTIRLVGGGGIVGIATEELPPDEDLASEVTSITSGTSHDSVPVAKQEGKQAKHKKNISSGLKKIGQLSGGGKRKKDSNSSSVKEVSI
jgi:hypothetical protein